MRIRRRAILRCPLCGAEHRETMPADYCQIVYRCAACGATLRPRPGDCCVYCSYADSLCPPKQRERAAG
ncbi:MAG: hypothetical protein KatS3mg060_0882 [Dehalococcoidia bacterium]|nr:MAG: hypothetical protein KatS3mg060_0882 [Dehalococcoidia bacterium]